MNRQQLPTFQGNEQHYIWKFYVTLIPEKQTKSHDGRRCCSTVTTKIDAQKNLTLLLFADHIDLTKTTLLAHVR